MPELEPNFRRMQKAASHRYQTMSRGMHSTNGRKNAHRYDVGAKDLEDRVPQWDCVKLFFADFFGNCFQDDDKKLPGTPLTHPMIMT